MAAKFGLTHRGKVATPLPVEELAPYAGQATPEEIHLFQQKVGSVQYPTIITRADAARSASKLAQFLTNPGLKHHDAIDRVIVHLLQSRFLAIQYGGTDFAHAVEIASDASFADNVDRKSSQGFLYKLYGGPID
jgi:hypothetical protein